MLRNQRGNILFWVISAILFIAIALVLILPFIEENSIYDQLDMKADVMYSKYPSGQFIHETIIPTYICPSDDGEKYFPNNGYSAAQCGGAPDMTDIRILRFRNFSIILSRWY